MFIALVYFSTFSLLWLFSLVLISLSFLVWEVIFKFLSNSFLHFLLSRTLANPSLSPVPLPYFLKCMYFIPSYNFFTFFNTVLCFPSSIQPFLYYLHLFSDFCVSCLLLHRVSIFKFKNFSKFIFTDFFLYVVDFIIILGNISLEDLISKLLK